MHHAHPHADPVTTGQHNWLHLDLKGINPSAAKLLDWLDFFAQCGFTGIVWEYEDRYDWQAFPGVAREPYSRQEWAAIWARCKALGLAVTPLVQTHGHLEWLLKHEAYADWREAGFFNELCPQNSQAVAHIHQWLDEVIDLHPDSTYVHIGGDETWNLCSCQACQEVAAGHVDGKMSIYMKQVVAMCQQVLDSGKKPMIWADMFWRENRMDLADQLPRGVVLVDWQYTGAAPFATTEQLRHAGLELWGASAIRRSYDTTLMQPAMDTQLLNVTSWNKQLAQGRVQGVIHTTWGRSRSLMPLYGPWEGWIPGFIAAGGGIEWDSHPLFIPTRLLQRCMDTPLPMRPDADSQAIELALAQLPAHADGFSRQCLRWWALAVEQQRLRAGVVTMSLAHHALKAVDEHVGLAPEIIQVRQNAQGQIVSRLEELEQKLSAFFEDNELGDGEEYIASRVGNLRQCLRPAEIMDRQSCQAAV